jgi:hypothetical protein
MKRSDWGVGRGGAGRERLWVGRIWRERFGGGDLDLVGFNKVIRLDDELDITATKVFCWENKVTFRVTFERLTRGALAIFNISTCRKRSFSSYTRLNPPILIKFCLCETSNRAISEKKSGAGKKNLLLYFCD